jgi:predicted RNase H-like nuclease (RuvC/YqgF family)
MLDLLFRPLRAAIKAVERASPLEETESEVLDAVRAIHQATDSIEHHVEVIEQLATSVGPLTDSVDHLTATMDDLVKMLAPLASTEREVARADHEAKRVEQGVGQAQHRVEHFLGFRRKQPAGPDARPPDATSPDV